VIAVLAVGLGIAVAITAFAPTAPTSSPAAVGIHEANYDVEGENQSPLTWYFRVHTGIELRDAEEFDQVAELITRSAYDTLVDYLLDNHGYKIKDLRAGSILQAIRLPPQEGDIPQLRLALSTEGQGESGYWFHVSMRFEINRERQTDMHKQFIRHLQEGNLGTDGIQGILRQWELQGLIRGERPLAIVSQVKRREPPKMHDPGR
jgi:hypothetical protein